MSADPFRNTVIDIHLPFTRLPRTIPQGNYHVIYNVTDTEPAAGFVHKDKLTGFTMKKKTTIKVGPPFFHGGGR
jgi:hypothetical protein